jgi:hypothetical protein
MKNRFYTVNGKTICVSFRSSAFGKFYYDLQLCGRGNLPSTEIWTDEGGEARTKDWSLRDSGLTHDDCVAAFQLYKNEKHQEFLEWKERNAALLTVNI